MHPKNSSRRIVLLSPFFVNFLLMELVVRMYYLASSSLALISPSLTMTAKGKETTALAATWSVEEVF